MTDSTDPLRSRGVRAEAARAEAARAEAARAGGDEPTQPILERLLEDQRDCCRRGEPFVVETYLEQQPSLRADPEAILDLIYNEMMLRESRGEKPGLDEYLRRFPSLADQLQMQFEVESALQAEGDGHADGLAADTWKGGRPPSDIGLPTPETDGGYELLEVLGRGGMGVVYKARQRSLNRLVALKMIRAHAAPDDLVRLRIEAEAIARLQHPNIVQIIEVGEMDGGPFLALEYVAGGSLAQQLNGKPWPAPRAAELTETLARAVHCAHEQGIVHRDLKPANILLRRKSDNRAPESETIARLETVKSDAAAMSSGPSTPDFEPKITDFGLAKLTVGNSAELTATGDFLGTPSYTAPEQAMGRVHAIGPATDVYALGAILYELLTGRPPFQGTSALDTLDQVRRQEPVPPSRLQSKLSRDLETICLKCLEKEPRKRYASALLLAEDLRRFQSGQPITARPVRWTERAWKWARRHPAGAGLIAVTALASLALALGGWLTAGALSRSANELKRSAEREHDLRLKAEEHFARAVSAVEQMLTEVGDVDLADVPQLEPVRKKLLLRAKSFYDKFLEERGRDDSLRYLAGRALSRLADIQDMLGEHVPAEESYVKACAFLEANEADSAESRRELGRALNGLGRLYKTLGRLAKAQTALRHALDLRGDLAKNDSRADLQRELADSHYHLATVLARRPNQRAPAKLAYEEALRIQRELTDADPHNAGYQNDRARTLNNLGIFLRNDLKQAESVLQQAVKIHTVLLQEHPGTSGYRRGLARTYNNLATVFAQAGLDKKLAQAGLDKKAEDYFSRALELFRQLAADFPTVPAYRNEQAGVYNSLGLFLQGRRRFAEAEKALQQGIRLREKLAFDAPLVPEYQHGLALVHMSLAALYRKQQLFHQSDRQTMVAIVLLGPIARPASRAAYHSDLGVAWNQRALLRLTFARFRDASQALEVVLTPARGGAWPAAALAVQTRRTLVEAQDGLARAVACQQTACAADPENLAFTQLLYGHHTDEIEVALLLGDHAVAARAARALPLLFPEQAREYELAARNLARCIPLVRADGRLPAGQRDALIEEYAADAVKHLQMSVRRGLNNVQVWQRLADFEPLQQRADFLNLVDQLEKNKQQKA